MSDNQILYYTQKVLIVDRLY